MKHECYDRCYQIMCISDIIKERGYDFDCYEDLWEQSNEIYCEWEEWDIANDTDKLSWLDSLNKFLDNKEKSKWVGKNVVDAIILILAWLYTTIMGTLKEVGVKNVGIMQLKNKKWRQIMFDLDKELKKIKKMQKVELKKRKDDKMFTRSSLDDALSVAILKLALKDDLKIKGGK